MRGWIVLVVGALLVAPLAAATPASGRLKLSGALVTPPGAVIDLPLDALLLADTAGIRLLELHAEDVSVRRLATSSVDVEAPVQRIQVATGGEDASYSLSHVRATLEAGEQAGWLGLLGDARSLATWTADGAASTRADAAPLLATGGPAEGDEFPYVRTERSEARVRAVSAGTLVYEGPIRLKIGGPDLRIEARENTTTLRTGADHEPGPAGRSEVRWALLASPHAILRLGSEQPIDAIAPSATLSWDGEAELGGATGDVDTRDGALVATGGIARVDGSLRFDARPQGSVLEGALEGDLRASSLATRGALVPTRASVPPWGAALTLGLLFVVAVAALLARRRGQPKLEADDCLEMAHLALAVDRLDEAKLWLARARRMSPRSGRLMLEEGQLLERMGQPDAAMRLYAQAERAMPTRGDADLAMARLLGASGAARDEAEAHLARALERSPVLLLEIEADERLRDLLAAPQVRAAVRAARDALE